MGLAKRLQEEVAESEPSAQLPEWRSRWIAVLVVDAVTVGALVAVLGIGPELGMVLLVGGLMSLPSAVGLRQSHRVASGRSVEAEVERILASGAADPPPTNTLMGPTWILKLTDRLDAIDAPDQRLWGGILPWTSAVAAVLGVGLGVVLLERGASVAASGFILVMGLASAGFSLWARRSEARRRRATTMLEEEIRAGRLACDSHESDRRV